MGRYRVLEVPDVQPGSCCNCGASRNDGRKYLDTGRHVEWYGAIFFCGHCLREYAEAMGLFDMVKVELELVKEKLLAQSEIDVKQEQLEDIVLRTFEEVKALYVSVHPDSAEFFPDSSPNVEHEPPAPDKSTTSETESGTVKPATSPGRPDIRSLANILKN